MLLKIIIKSQFNESQNSLFVWKIIILSIFHIEIHENYRQN